MTSATPHGPFYAVRHLQPPPCFRSRSVLTREIGIRLALGATRGSAIWLVLRDALVIITVGTAIALPCVAALGRLVESRLFGLKPTDPLVIAAATLLLTSAALGAALIPAYRASTVNPADALRFD